MATLFGIISQRVVAVAAEAAGVGRLAPQDVLQEGLQPGREYGGSFWRRCRFARGWSHILSKENSPPRGRRAGTTAANMKTCEPTHVALAKRRIQKTIDSPVAGLLDDGVDDDRLIPFGSNRNEVDAAADELLDALDIGLGRRRQVLEATYAAGVL